MTPRKANPQEAKPVLTIRIPAEIMRQLDELSRIYEMNRTQVILMAIAKEHAIREKLQNSQPTAVQSTVEDRMNTKRATQLAKRAVENVTVGNPETVAEMVVVYKNQDGTYSVTDNGEEVVCNDKAQAVKIIVEDLQ